MSHQLTSKVSDLLLAVASQVILPAFRSTVPLERWEKDGGEIVTKADQLAEQRITEGLLRLLPRSVVIGEEACAAQPRLLERIGDGVVWIIDPIDGTKNFAAGQEPFAIMVALLEDGTTRGAWILDPLRARLTYSTIEGGTFVGGRRVSTASCLPDDQDLTGILSTAFLPQEQQGLGELLRAKIGTVIPTKRCAGFEYPAVAVGEQDFAIYWRTLAWDHAPGAFLLTQAGGRVIHLDGTPYDPGSNRIGLIAARNPAIANRLLDFVN